MERFGSYRIYYQWQILAITENRRMHFYLESVGPVPDEGPNTHTNIQIYKHIAHTYSNTHTDKDKHVHLGIWQTIRTS